MGKHLAFALILAAVVPITATGQVATYNLIDPVVAGLLSGSSVTTNTNAIAAATTGVVKGTAADGTTQVILRIPASSVGQQFTVTVINDANSPSTSVPNDGGVFALGGSPSSAASSLVVTAVAITGGAEAFAIYLAPVNFSRSSSDNTLTTRSVTLQVSSSSAVTGNASVTVARPPVVLVHGLWGSAASFSNFTPLTTDKIFDINYATYDNAITGITSTTPSYPASDPIEANSLASQRPLRAGTDQQLHCRLPDECERGLGQGGHRRAQHGR